MEWKIRDRCYYFIDETVEEMRIRQLGYFFYNFA